MTPRSLADDLRTRDDAALAALLRRRPDLLHPVPSDITALAGRATTGPSVARCVDGLDALHLHVLRTLADMTVSDPASDGAVVAAASTALPPDAVGAVEAALGELVALALAWGTADERRAVHAARDLVAHAAAPTWPPPALDAVAPAAPADVDAQAALHAREAISLVRDLLDDWSVHPPGVLRSGGLALRDLAAARAALHGDWGRTSLTIEVAHAARLVVDDEGDPPHWVPTDHFDTWLGLHTAEQWIELVRAWLALPRLPSLADARTQVLTAERDRRAVPVLRRQVLDLLLQAPAGAAPTAASVLAVLDDRQPRRSGELRALAVQATLAEASALGITGGGALSHAGRLLLSSPDGSAERRAHDALVAQALTAALPEDLGHVLIQADLTVVAPGPLVAHVARTMRLLADVESRGHATVFRISEASLRRALDAGWDAAGIRSLLADVSTTPVPQPLDYLIDDVARRYGAVRVGPALAYLRCDNPETLLAIASERRLRPLGLHRVADTVLISHAPVGETIDALRAAGYAPAAEGPDGQVVVRRRDHRRARTPRAPRTSVRSAGTATLVGAAVKAIRAGDRAGTGRRGTLTQGPAMAVELPGLSAAAIAARLRRAVADTEPVWIGYADTDGGVTQQIVDPLRLSGGILTAFDHRTEQVRTFAVSRVTGVADTDGIDPGPSQDGASAPTG